MNYWIPIKNFPKTSQAPGNRSVRTVFSVFENPTA